MQRRDFLAAAAVAPFSLAAAAPKPKLGVDLFSIQSQGFSPFEYLDYCAKWKANVVHFSEIRFLGSLEDDHVRKVGEYARNLGIELEIGMMSICPTSSRFAKDQGTAEEQLTRTINAAKIAGSPLVRAVLGSSADRKGDIPIEGHIENTVKVLRNVRSRAMDAGIKIAVENHAGDMQGRELKTLIEGAGPDFVGACIDPGNAVWCLEDPHVTLDALAPYALTSHIRDSALWRTERGAAVAWVRTGEGNVDIDGWMRKYMERCPGKALTMEIIVGGAREVPYLEPDFWEGYENVPAWSFARFVALAEKGTPLSLPPRGGEARGGGGARGGGSAEDRAKTQLENFEASARYMQKFLGV